VPDILKYFQQQAKKKIKKIALPDSLDPRVLRSAVEMASENIAYPILVGNERHILQTALEQGLNLSNVEIFDVSSSVLLSEFTEDFYELRKSKITKAEAEQLIKNPLYFAGMLLRKNLCSACVAGASSTTADVIRAGVHTVGLQSGIKSVSSFFLIVLEQVFAFADCAVIPNPTPEQLAEIAIVTSANFKALLQTEPKVALLSYSTKGSASGESVMKVQQALEIIRSKNQNLIVDGELQLDAAIIPKVAMHKASGSVVAGTANVLVFPNLDAGNIAYKLAERLAGAKAIGPIVQGLAMPYFDLSRGCSVNDIINVCSIATILAQKGL